MGRPLIQVVMAWGLAILYGFLSLFSLITAIYKKGFKKVFEKCTHPRPVALDDPTLGTHGYLQLEEIRIHYVASGPEDKPLMLFLHGFPEFWYSWRYQIREFQKDYRCVAIDMRGYGESEKPSGIEAYTMTYLMSDVRQVILALGYKTCTLVSHDWGGAVAWAFGRFFPDMVDKLIVMNAPPSPIMAKLLQSDRKQFKMSWYFFFFQLPYLPEFLISIGDFHLFDEFEKKNIMMTVNPISKDDVEAYKYTYSQPGALTPPINYYRASFRGTPTMYDMEYLVPILLIWGTKDHALSTAIPDMVEKFSPSITVKRIADAAHFVQNDTPDRVNQVMREWLSSQQ